MMPPLPLLYFGQSKNAMDSFKKKKKNTNLLLSGGGTGASASLYLAHIVEIAGAHLGRTWELLYVAQAKSMILPHRSGILIIRLRQAGTKKTVFIEISFLEFFFKNYHCCN